VLCVKIAVEKAVQNLLFRPTCTRLSINVKAVYDAKRC